MRRPQERESETAIFAAGCFWHVQAVFHRIAGVIHTKVGYIGGKTPHPTYHQVCSGATGHAEAVLVEYDPTRIGYARLLDVFWTCHDPTQRNRQGPDIGSQYRSAIFYRSEEQKYEAHKSKTQLANSVHIVTEITPASAFYDAEEYHQMYLRKLGKA